MSDYSHLFPLKRSSDLICALKKNFDIPFIPALALREKQIQQNYRPIIAVHKWFARRPDTNFRGLILSEYGDRPSSPFSKGGKATEDLLI